MNKNEQFWTIRSRQYGRNIKGVLPKSFPPLATLYLDTWMYNEVKRLVSGTKRTIVLDVGCGYGRLSSRLLGEFAALYTRGIDIAQPYVELYNQDLRPRGKAVKGDMQKLPFRDRFFDGGFIVTTLMYVTSKARQENALREFFRVLKPNARFVIIERNPIGYSLVTLGGIVSFLRGAQHREIPSVSFAPHYLSQLIKKTGGTVDTLRGIPFFTVTLPVTFIISRFNQSLTTRFLRFVNKSDTHFAHLLTFSLYISYSGRKQK